MSEINLQHENKLMSKPDLRKSTKVPKAATRLAASVKNTKSATLMQYTAKPAMGPQTGGQRKEKLHAIKEFDGEASDKSLKKKSPWYASLRDPIQGGGAKIPDTVGINTAVMQLVQRLSVPVNAQGVAGLEITTPYINSVIGTGNYRRTDVNASTTISWTSASNFSNQASMQSVAQAHRVVSCAVYGEYEGTTLQDSGDVTCYVRPYTPNALTALPTLQTTYGTSVIPVNKARSKPVVARWFPVNVNNQSYKDFVAPNFSTVGIGACPQWSLGLYYNGLPLSTGSVIFTMVVNYEFIPTLNTIDFITPDPSPIDPIEEQLVQQWVQEDTQTGLTANRMVDVQPGSQVVSAASQGMNADSGFGMLGSVIKELAPTLIAALL